MAATATTTAPEQAGPEQAAADVHALLFGYSEWLDQQRLIAPETPEDQRTHDELVVAYLTAHPQP